MKATMYEHIQEAYALCDAWHAPVVVRQFLSGADHALLPDALIATTVHVARITRDMDMADGVYHTHWNRYRWVDTAFHAANAAYHAILAVKYGSEREAHAARESARLATSI